MDAAQVAKPTAAPQFSARRLIAAIVAALALGYLVVLAGTCLQGHFLTDLQDRPIANDFVDVYAAGRLALAGRAASAYDWPLHKAEEVRAVGHDFSGYYGWHYPPPFLFVAASLALLPYLGALVVWLAATLAAYASTLRFVVGDRLGAMLALGFPAAIWNMTAGQNGFLTATLVGGTLVSLQRRPIVAGVCLGLLTYKPQFGLLFPLALIADRRWLTIAVATAVAIALGAASLVAFGGASWLAFVHWLPISSHIILGEGGADFGRLQSFYGLVRLHGGGETAAWAIQAAGTLAVAAFVVWLWRAHLPFELRAAALAAGALVATPYVYMYDLAVLAVAVGFLLRFALERGVTVAEAAGLSCAGALILSFPYLKTQVGLLAVLIVLALVAQRALVELRQAKDR